MPTIRIANANIVEQLVQRGQLHGKQLERPRGPLPAEVMRRPIDVADEARLDLGRDLARRALRALVEESALAEILEPIQRAVH